MRVMTVVGTRPEIIRLSAVLRRLDSTPGIEHVLVHTGQNWDRQLNEVFFEDLGLRLPDFHLDVDTSSLGATLGDMLRKTEAVLNDVRPDAFLVLGDTNSALSLIMAKRQQIPTYHMEAGNRCFDSNVPEETNRRLVDHTADFNLAYTEHARRNLLAEGLETRRVIVTGSPMREVLDQNVNGIHASDVIERLGLDEGKFFVASAHREENVDNPSRLVDLLSCLNVVASRWGWPVLVSVHPRTRQRLETTKGLPDPHPLLRFHEPFGFLDYNALQLHAACALSDSGTIAEESSILGFAAVTLRGAIERPEALDCGSIIMVDLDPSRVRDGVEIAMASAGTSFVPNDYMIANTSERVVNFILSTASSHREWSGLR